MALNYFSVAKGIDIDESVQILYGSVDPTAGAGVAASTGSLYMRTNGEVWHKTNTLATDWAKLVDSAGASLEDGYQNAFTGKSGTGTEFPVYGATPNVVTSDSTGTAGDGDNLEEAITAIDTEIGAAVVAVTRTYEPISDQAINLNIDALDEAIGTDAEHASAVYSTVNASLKTNISELDAAINDLVYVKSANNQDADPAINIDTMVIADWITVEWLLTIIDTATPANRRTMKIVAMTDGTTVDYNKFSVLKLGAAIAGLTVTPKKVSTDLVLEVFADVNVDYRFVRTRLPA